MNKSIVTILACTFLILCILPYRANATTLDSDNIIYLDDGSYIVETISIAATKAMGQISATKVHTCYNSADVVQWEAEVHGDFTYTGTVAI